MDDDKGRVKIMKDNLRFTSKFDVSSEQKNLVVVVQLHLPEDVISEKLEPPKYDEYDVFQREITIKDN